MLVDRCRIDRALEFVDRLMTEEHAVSGVLSTAKSSIERSAFVGVLGALAVWLAEHFTGHTKRVPTPNSRLTQGIKASPVRPHTMNLASHADSSTPSPEPAPAIRESGMFLC